MYKLSNSLFLLCAVIILVKGQQKSYTKFTDTLSVRDKVIYTARTFGFETENFYYAVCAQPHFEHRHCNVTIQKESQKRTCPVRIAPTDMDDILIFQSQPIFYPLNDDKVIIRWTNYVGFHWKANDLKILDISTCELVDVPLPAAQITYVVAYKNTVDLGFWDKDYCGSNNCKITVNADGQLISGPTDTLNDVHVSFLEPLGPVNQNVPDEGFYASVGVYPAIQGKINRIKTDNCFFKINGHGESIKFMTFTRSHQAKPSNNNDLFSLCYTVDKTNTKVVCIQYDKSLNLILNKTLEFEDGNFKRWVQPYNLKNGGLLLVTGRASDVKGTRYDTFSVIKIQQDGRTDEAIELNFEAPWIGSMIVSLLEKESGEICAHFIDTHQETDNEGRQIYILQLAIKCLTKA